MAEMVRHRSTGFGFTPCRRATIETVLLGSKRALTIAGFSSTDLRRRHSGPVNASG